MPNDRIQDKPSPPEATKETRIEGKKEGKPEQKGDGFIVLEHWS